MPETNALIPPIMGVAKQPGSASSWQKGATAWMCPILCLHLAIGTAIWNWLLEGDSAAGIPTSFYFAVVTFLTIGYGDITPASPASKAFYIIYIAMSLVVQLTVVSTFVSNAVSLGSQPIPSGASARGRPGMLLKVWPRLVRAGQGVAVVVAFVAGGAALLHALEGADWLDAFYWSLTTLSTTGYGDITPSGHRVLFAVWFLLAVIVFSYVLSEIVGIVVEVGRLRRLQTFLAPGVTPELIDQLDRFQDGQGDTQVSRAEFMLFVLQELQLVEAFQLERVLQLFEAMDVTGDGVLSIADVRAQLARDHGGGEVESGGPPRDGAGPSHV